MTEFHQKSELNDEFNYASPEQIKIMQKYDKEIDESGGLDKVLGPGDIFPDFALPNQHGETLSPLVTF